jgi:hypothetical protein
MEEIEQFMESTTTKDEGSEKINFFRLDRKCMFKFQIHTYFHFLTKFSPPLVFKCSSKTGEGINEIIEFVAKTIAQDERFDQIYINISSLLIYH